MSVKKILLIQIRDDQVTLEEELNAFVEFSGLSHANFTSFNLIDKNNFGLDILEGHDAVMVGGSSDVSVCHPERYPFMDSLNKLLVHCVDNNIPTFASCFGFQSAVVALGGEVVNDKQNMEMGTYEICLNQKAYDDALFKNLPDKFWAVSGHADRAVVLPDNFVNLAYTDKCPYHAFKILNKPFYATQFHPEVNKQILIDRITRYKDRYLDDDGHLQEIIDTSQDTPIANALITQFVDLYLKSSFMVL